MGTNFTWKILSVTPAIAKVFLPTGPVEVSVSSGLSDEHPQKHIGKRSAAGLYCWDCGLTLCPGGNPMVHRSNADAWPDICRSCGKKASEEKWDDSAAGVELGIAKPKNTKPSGVRSVMSFSWAQDPAVVRKTCEANMDTAVILTEYDEEMTGREFLRMLAANCPIEFTDHIGEYFS